jgi:hypothetical protein
MGQLVWLASYPKSGNTWTRNFLHNLLGTEVEDDTHDINAMNKKTSWDSAWQWYQPFLPEGRKDFTECSRVEIAQARLRANERMANSVSPNGLLFVKTHNAMAMDCDIPMVNAAVTAAVVYIIRNPLDVAISYSHHMNFTIDQTIKFMAVNGAMTAINHPNMAYEVMGSWSEHVHSWTRIAHGGLHIMRYEDMLHKPQETFSQLARFLRIPVSKEKLDDVIEKSSFKKLRAIEDEKGFREKPKHAKNFFRKGETDQWRSELTETQINQIINNHREVMERFDYIPEEYQTEKSQHAKK